MLAGAAGAPGDIWQTASSFRARFLLETCLVLRAPELRAGKDEGPRLTQLAVTPQTITVGEYFQAFFKAHLKSGYYCCSHFRVDAEAEDDVK